MTEYFEVIVELLYGRKPFAAEFGLSVEYVVIVVKGQTVHVGCGIVRKVYPFDSKNCS